MSTPAIPIHSNLDRWLDPPWRAFLIWITLAALCGAVRKFYWWEFVESPLKWIEVFVPIHAWIASIIRLITPHAISALLGVWYQPLLLRLGVLRGLAWIAIFIALYFRRMLVPDTYDDWRDALHCIPFWVALVPVLWGRRTRPWMAFVAAALSLTAYRLHTPLISEIPGLEPIGVVPESVSSIWFWEMLPPTVSGAVLLLGTRLLHPKESVALSDPASV